jgi:hypothetical protein
MSTIRSQRCWHWLGALALLTLADRASAQPPAVAPPPGATGVAETGAPTKPEEVVVGLYVNQVHEFSLKENSFTVDFYLWFRWKNPELRPYETFSIVDGRIESQVEPIVRDLPDGSKHAYTRVVAKVTRFFDTRAYPLDNHQLTIIVEEEDSETHKLRYVADEVNSAASPTILLPGWVFQRLSTEAGVGKYRSNFGDTSLPTGNESDYARLTTAVSFTRIGATYFTKLFFALWVCVLVALLVFFIRPIDVDPRFGLGVGALFAAVASQYVVTAALPDTNVVTLADKLHLTAFFFILLSIVQSTWSLWLYENEKVEQSKRIDRLAQLTVPAAYVIANVVIVWLSA